MLTSNDSTIPNALEKLDEVLAGGVRHIGFKDVGLPFDDLKASSKKNQGGGRQVIPGSG